MTNAEELHEIVEQRMDDPFILGRLASRLRKNNALEQRHKDDKKLDTFWRNTGAYWRFTIFLDGSTDDCLAQVDLHQDGTVRVESFEPCSITIDPSEDLLVLTRYMPAPLKKR